MFLNFADCKLVRNITSLSNDVCEPEFLKPKTTTQLPTTTSTTTTQSTINLTSEPTISSTYLINDLETNSSDSYDNINTTNIIEITNGIDALHSSKSVESEDYNIVVGFLVLFLLACVVLCLFIWRLRRKVKELKNEDFICHTLTNHEVVSALLGPISGNNSNTLTSLTYVNTNQDVQSHHTHSRFQSNASVAVHAPSLESCVNQEYTEVPQEQEDQEDEIISGYISVPEIGNLPCEEKIQMIIDNNHRMSCPEISRVECITEICEKSHISINHIPTHNIRTEDERFWVISQSTPSLKELTSDCCDPVCLAQQKLNLEYLKVKRNFTTERRNSLCHFKKSVTVTKPILKENNSVCFNIEITENDNNLEECTNPKDNQNRTLDNNKQDCNNDINSSENENNHNQTKCSDISTDILIHHFIGQNSCKNNHINDVAKFCKSDPVQGDNAYLDMTAFRNKPS